MQHGGDNMQDWTPMVLNSKKATSAPLAEKKSLTAEQKKTIELTNVTDAQKQK